MFMAKILLIVDSWEAYWQLMWEAASEVIQDPTDIVKGQLGVPRSRTVVLPWVFVVFSSDSWGWNNPLNSHELFWAYDFFGEFSSQRGTSNKNPLVLRMFSIPRMRSWLITTRMRRMTSLENSFIGGSLCLKNLDTTSDGIHHKLLDG